MKTVLALLTLLVLLTGCTRTPEEKALNTFIEKHVSAVEPLQKEAALAYWNAAVTGDEKMYDKSAELEFKIKQIYSNADDYTQLKRWKKSGKIKNELLLRQLDKLINAYLPNQIDTSLMKKIVKLGTQIEKKFSTYRPSIDGKQVTNNQIDEILKTETDSKKRMMAWNAGKSVGGVVAEDIIQLVKLRNQAARQLGFENYHTMSLAMNEQKVEQIQALFDQLFEQTKEPFSKLKTELDQKLSDMYGVGIRGIMPWHYHDLFFQEAPQVYQVDLDKYYVDKDVKELAETFYKSIGLPVENILKNSDLYEKEKKNPHAFCTDIDRQGDVRILCNIKNNERWMETTLHELGHAVYDYYHDATLPYLLREPAHIFTTEGIAMFFGRLSRNPYWMQTMLQLTDEQRDEIKTVSDKYMVMKQLIFARWAMVMFNFERQLYADPDQDLNTLWWNLKQKYQLLTKPGKRSNPDWASKIHFAIAPCYYHNYLLGELFASQLHHYLVKEVMKAPDANVVSYVNEKEVGEYLKMKVFKPGARYPWNEMIQKATGEPLSPHYFVQQFVK